MAYLKQKYYSRMSVTCRKMNEQIWSHLKLVALSEWVFKRHFANKLLDTNRFSNLESLNIPSITTQVLHLSRLTSLEVKYDYTADQALIIKQLTQLYALGIYSAENTISDLTAMLGDGHSKLTNLRVHSFNYPIGLFQVPVMSRLKALSLRLERLRSRSIEATTLEPLFNMTNLEYLEIRSIRVTADRVTGFSRLINLQDVDFFSFTSSSNANIINFEEFQAMKALTRLDVFEQRLVEEDIRNIGKLTTLVSLYISEYYYPPSLEYLSGLTNLTRLWQSASERNDMAPQFKYLTKLEYILTPVCATITQLQHLPRLTDLSFTLGHMTSEQLCCIGSMTQLHALDISNDVLEGTIDFSGLINVTCITLCIGLFNDQRRLLDVLMPLTNLKVLQLDYEGVSEISADEFHSLQQLTQLTKLYLYSAQENTAFNLDSLPYKVKLVW